MPADLQAYALRTLLPLCRDRFADAANGGFHELLDAAGAPMGRTGKRLMVQARLLYVLAQAASLGDRSGQPAAERGYAFLRRAYEDPTHGGWYFRVTDAGEPMDRDKDCYAHAFLLFAFAWLHRAFAAPDALALARSTYELMQRRLATPHGGLWDRASADWTPRPGPQRQNPHMHLLEAVLALHEATGAPDWLAEADALVSLCLDRFIDPATSTLGEYFTNDWQPHPEHGHAVEPGHHYEWVWLLDRYHRQGGRIETQSAAARLFAFAETHGFDPTHGGLHDVIDRAGAPVLSTRRIWPVTEAIKAHAVYPGGDPAPLVAHLFRHFLDPATRGWIETATQDGVPTRTHLPGSTPYHLFMAAAELSPSARPSPAHRPARPD